MGWVCDRDLANPPTRPQWLVLEISYESNQANGIQCWDFCWNYWERELFFRDVMKLPGGEPIGNHPDPQLGGGDGGGCGIHLSSLWEMVYEVGAKVFLPLNHGIWNFAIIVPLADVGLPDLKWQSLWDGLYGLKTKISPKPPIWAHLLWGLMKITLRQELRIQWSWQDQAPTDSIQVLLSISVIPWAYEKIIAGGWVGWLRHLWVRTL